MKKWKVIIEYNGEQLELIIEGRYYSDAYLTAEKNYPGCDIKSITEAKN